MVDISDLSCEGNDGKTIHGTAAVLHRMFGNQEIDDYDKEADVAEYNRLVKELGYGNFDE